MAEHLTDLENLLEMAIERRRDIAGKVNPIQFQQSLATLSVQVDIEALTRAIDHEKKLAQKPPSADSIKSV